MVIGIFGESCTGKSSLADELHGKRDSTIYAGKEYLKLAKSEAEARSRFIELLKAHEDTDETLIYVISEKDQLALLPEKAIRVLMTAGLDTIKERFAKRMNGSLPARSGRRNAGKEAWYV